MAHADRTGERCKAAEEGGCGVIGFAATVPVGGRHIFEPFVQMHNRGNGKGGGIAAAGLVAGDLGVSQEMLDNDYLFQVAFSIPQAREAGRGRVHHNRISIWTLQARSPTVDDYRDIKAWKSRPPDVWRYFVRVKPERSEAISWPRAQA